MAPILRNPAAKTQAALLLLFLSCAGPLRAADWPHWRGAERDGVIAEDSGWETGAWPPKENAWQSNVGEGASSPVIAKDNLYIVGWRDGHDVVSCLDAASGKVRWSQRYPAPNYGRRATGDQRMYRGTTATPELDEKSGMLFTLGCDGDLHAWDAGAGGKKLWHRNLYDDFDVPRRPQITKRKNTLRDYGYTTAPFAFGDWVIVEVGDPKRGCVMGFDQRTGEVRWKSENRDPAGHTGGLVPITVAGVPCLAVATSWHVLVIRLDAAHAGKTVAEFEWKTDFSNTIAGIAVQDSDLLVSSRYNQMAMARLSIDLKNGAREVWRNRYPTGVCTPVIHDGKIYFANRGIFCVDFDSGDLEWAGGNIGDAGSCFVTADDRLVVWGNGGDLSLFETAKRAPKKCISLSERRGIFDDMAWPHVVAAGGHLFVKTLDGELACFALATRPKT